MTSRTATRRRAGAPPPPPRRVPVVAVALAALAAVVVVGIVIALAGGDGPDRVDELAFGEVAVDGTPLPVFEGTAPDAAVGQQAPVLIGEAPDGAPARVGDRGEPTLVAFLAHWCPHCQVELPVLVELAAEGAFDGIRTVAVLTGTNPQAPNFPPAEWLDSEGWTGDVLVDDEAFTGAFAYGLDGYPFLVVLDGDGRVAARSSGEVPAEAVESMVAGLAG